MYFRSTLPFLVAGISSLASAAPRASIDSGCQWTNLTRVPVRRQEHTTVAVNETTIAVVGGTLALGNSSIQTGVETTNLVQLYDIPSDTWHTVAPAPFAVNHPNVEVVDGKIYLLGGLVDAVVPPVELIDWTASGESYVYDPETDTWTELEPMPNGTQRGSAIMGVHGEMIYLAGGMTVLSVGYQDAITMVIAFNTTSGEWQRVPEHAANIPDARQHGAGAVIGDIFYVIGGRWFEKTNVRGDVFMLNLADQEAGWTTSEASMPTARGGIAGAAVGDRIFTFGGEANPDAENGIFPQVEVFDTQTQQWAELDPMSVPRHGTSAVAVGNTIYIPGGGLQDDGLPVVIDGVVRYMQMTDHFDSFTV